MTTQEKLNQEIAIKIQELIECDLKLGVPAEECEVWRTELAKPENWAVVREEFAHMALWVA